MGVATTHISEHAHEHEHVHHHKEHFITKYVFSQDHKMISKQFLVTAIFMAVVAMLMSILFRLQLGWPGENFQILTFFLGEKWAPDGILDRTCIWHWLPCTALSWCFLY